MADLNGYFTQMRENEKSIPDEFPIVVSHKTGDGGVAGRLTEVTRRIAARLLVEGAAHLADIMEAENFRKAKQQAKASAESMAASAKLELAVAAAAEVERLAKAAAAAAAPKE
jgi:hypothetical protein